MIIFKNYFKMVRAHKWSILVYSILFGLVSLINAQIATPVSTIFESYQPKIAYFDQANTPLSMGLETYLNEIGDVVALSEEQAEDQLFIGLIQAKVNVDSNFTYGDTIEYKAAAGDYGDVLVQQNINQFLKTAEIYHEADMTDQEVIDATLATMRQEVEVSLLDQNNQTDHLLMPTTYFNFLNYVLMAQVIIVIGVISRAYNAETILKRQQISPKTKWSFNLPLVAGHVVMSVLIWLGYMVLMLILFVRTVELDILLWYALNSFIFLLSVMALGFLLSRLFTSPETASGVSNVVSLATSFFGGAFVPQSMLPALTLVLGRLFPTFYYIENNNQMLSGPQWSLIYQNWLIMSVFTVAFILVSIVIKPKPIRKKS